MPDRIQRDHLVFSPQQAADQPFRGRGYASYVYVISGLHLHKIRIDKKGASPQWRSSFAIYKRGNKREES